MLYVGSNDAIEKYFKWLVQDRFNVKCLGSAQWFLQMRINRHKDQTYTLDQHRYTLNITLKRNDPDSRMKEHNTPFPIEYTFHQATQTYDDQEGLCIQTKYNHIDFRSAVCTLLYLAYNTRANIVFAVTKLAKACIDPSDKDYHALCWLLGY